MKLPEDRKERIKILILAAIGGVAVIFTLVTLLVKPLLARKADRKEQIEELATTLAAAEADVGRMLAERDENIRVLEQIVELANQQGYILEPRLGNYELGAHAFVDSVAQEAGVEVATVQELGVTPLPQAAEPKFEHALRCYNLHVTLRAGTHALHRMLRVIESRNPYVVVSGITILAVAEEPALHNIGLDLQWPVWADPQHSQQLQQRLEESRLAVQSQALVEPVPGG